MSYVFLVHYEIPPMRAILQAEYAETAQSTDELVETIHYLNPSWRILKVERGIRKN